MSKDVVKEALDKYRNIILNEKGKRVTISVEQLNALHDDITRLQNENERLKIDNERLSIKAKEQEKKQEVGVQNIIIYYKRQMMKYLLK